MRTWLTAESWRQRGTPAGVGVLKVYSTKTTPVADRTITFTASTETVDRHGDTIKVSGWELDHYRRSPVVLWAHDANALPIGKATRVWTDARALHATIEFTPWDIYPLGAAVYDLVREGYLNAVSVGFLPLEWSYAEDREGINVLRQELLEISVVPIPANPEALSERQLTRLARRGLLEPIYAWATCVLGDLPRTPGHLSAAAATTRDAINALAVPKSVRVRLPDGSVKSYTREELRAEIRRAVRDAVRIAAGRLD